MNTLRGPIVDEADLIASLRAQNIAGAAIDVLDREPLPFDYPFRTLPNLLDTPHIGYVSRGLCTCLMFGFMIFVIHSPQAPSLADRFNVEMKPTEFASELRSLERRYLRMRNITDQRDDLKNEKRRYLSLKRSTAKMASELRAWADYDLAGDMTYAAQSSDEPPYDGVSWPD